MEVKVVIGANLGDEGKGLVSGSLARNRKAGQRLLTVLFNGGAQRAHTLNYDSKDVILHNVGAGDYFGGETYYHPRFLVDPIALLITGEKPIIDPMCRVVLPCDVVANRSNKDTLSHGTCGMGIFACSQRSRTENAVKVADLMNDFELYNRIKEFSRTDDDLYNLDMFMRAVSYIKKNCEIKTFDEIKYDYDLVIFEAGQGLLLDQGNLGDFPHLTPSSTGSRNISQMIQGLDVIPELYYVSRTYLTRHGNGPMDYECSREEINKDIVDMTNMPNPWQGSLRFGKLDIEKLKTRIKRDLENYSQKVSPRLVLTQTNYTDGKIMSPTGLKTIEPVSFLDKIYVSDNKVDFSELV